jgi:hypothetical protein
LRGVKSELQGGLEGSLSEVGEEVTNLLLALVDDGPCGGGVDGDGNVKAELLEATAQLLKQILGGELGLAVHGVFSRRMGVDSLCFFQRRLLPPGRFATPPGGNAHGFSPLRSRSAIEWS